MNMETNWLFNFHMIFKNGWGGGGGGGGERGLSEPTEPSLDPPLNSLI